MLPNRDRGIATTGIITERTSPRNRNTTIRTMMEASRMVLLTSVMEDSMDSAASKLTPTNTPSGITAASSSSLARTWRAISRGLTPGAAVTARDSPRSPHKTPDAGELGVGLHLGEHPPALHLPRRGLETAPGHRPVKFLHRDIEGRQLHRVEPQAHGVLPCAVGGDTPHPGQGEDLRLDDPVHVI